MDKAESSFDEEGLVTAQDPRGGSSVETGSKVRITVGTGPSTVKVPSVYGNTPNQAAEILADYELELGTVSEDYSSDVAEGQIFYQDPAEGERIEPGSAVTVTVSIGPEQVEVPEVFGLTLKEAQDALASVGLFSSAVEVEDNEPAGTALSTEPGAGTLVDPQSTVTLYYSGGPAEPTIAPPAPNEDDGGNAANLRESLRQALQGNNDANNPQNNPQSNPQSNPQNNGRDDVGTDGRNNGGNN